MQEIVPLRAGLAAQPGKLQLEGIRYKGKSRLSAAFLSVHRQR